MGVEIGWHFRLSIAGIVGAKRLVATFAPIARLLCCFSSSGDSRGGNGDPELYY
ncbi:hypothetical protein [Methylocystis heyeri]|uniref:Uncharacterized protein n=1 Tax=Methylocystis heyeri TaxID=391905 RepID=A0A6B8KDE8_9HYPH|nr:hypothetical protein [Methylocystis heyeri]QGM44453.1 hypothetical protein H2LOC_001360 [Methylocystis heyeri]